MNPIAYGVRRSLACSLFLCAMNLSTASLQDLNPTLQCPQDTEGTSKTDGAATADLHFPNHGTVNALTIWSNSRMIRFGYCGEVTGSEDNGYPTSIGRQPYDDYCAGRSADGWNVGDLPSWTA